MPKMRASGRILMDDAFIPIYTKIMVKHFQQNAYATDKFLSDGYMDTYFRLAEIIGPSGNVCEIGVDRGGSLAIWDDMFPDGKIIGVDIRPDAIWPVGIPRMVMSQDDPNLSNHLLDFLRHDGSFDFFDLIIDDASHVGTATETTFLNLWPLVKPGRWYVIEDWGVGYPGAPMYDYSMSVFVSKLPEYMGKKLMDIHTIEYRHGMIVIAKKI